MSRLANPNAVHLGEQLTFWGAMSTQQAVYYLERFFHVKYAPRVVEQLCHSHYICHLHNDENVISCTNGPFATFSQGKEKCLWVFFRYLEMYFYGNKDLQIITQNSMNGVDFIMGVPGDMKFYCLCYVSSADLTYRTWLLKTKRDEMQKYLFVTDSKEEAAKIVKINADDIIFYVSDKDHSINIYKGE